MARLTSAALLCAAVLVVNGCSSPPPPAEPGLTPADIEGTWTPVEMNDNGNPVTGPRLKRIEFIFDNGKYNQGELNADGKGGTAVGQHAYNLDAKQLPTKIALVNLEPKDMGKEQRGIVERDGDRLKLCLGSLGGEPPTTFAPGPKITYAVLERKQK